MRGAEPPLTELPSPPSGPPFALLGGVTVLDLSTSIAGPYAGHMLAEMGAEVIKVERRGAGDDTRHWGPPFLDRQSLWYLSVNRNKRSVALDFSAEGGQAVVHALARTCDAVLVNHPPRVQRKLQIDAETLMALKPDLVHCSLTGFGAGGERADWVCYDLIAEGYSGIMDVTGELDGPPQKVGTPAADMLAGMDAAYAILAALFDRARSGRGHRLDVSLVESMSRFLMPRLVSYLGSGEAPRRSGGRDSVIAVYQTFDTADEPITLALGNDNIWKRFWAALGSPERGEQPETDSNVKRREAREQIVAEIQALLAERPREHWLALFAEARVPCGPINRVDQVHEDATLRERHAFYAMPGAGESSGPVPQMNTGILVDGRPNSPRSAPPVLGQDTEAVLRERLGYDEERLAALREKDIV